MASSSSTLTAAQEKILSKLYYEKHNFVGENAFVKIVRQDWGVKIPPKLIKQWMNRQDLHVRKKKPKKLKPEEYSSVMAYRPNEDWEWDTCIFRSKPIGGYQYYTVIIDIYSRKILCLKPLTNHEGPTNLKTLEDTVKQFGKPFNLNCDNEFNTTAIGAFIKNHDINVIFSPPNEKNKNPVVERVIRTISQRLVDTMMAEGNSRFYKYLDEIKNKLNSAVNSTTGQVPDDMYRGYKIGKGVAANAYGQYLMSKQVPNQANIYLQPGELVKVQNKNRLFKKGYKSHYSDESYAIKDQVGEKFRLHGRDGLYRQHELMRVDNLLRPISERPRAGDKKIPRARPGMKKIRREVETENMIPGSRLRKRNAIKRSGAIGTKTKTKTVTDADIRASIEKELASRGVKTVPAHVIR